MNLKSFCAFSLYLLVVANPVLSVVPLLAVRKGSEIPFKSLLSVAFLLLENRAARERGRHFEYSFIHRIR